MILAAPREVSTTLVLGPTQVEIDARVLDIRTERADEFCTVGFARTAKVEDALSTSRLRRYARTLERNGAFDEAQVSRRDARIVCLQPLSFAPSGFMRRLRGHQAQPPF